MLINHGYPTMCNTGRLESVELSFRLPFCFSWSCRSQMKCRCRVTASPDDAVMGGIREREELWSSRVTSQSPIGHGLHEVSGMALNTGTMMIQYSLKPIIDYMVVIICACCDVMVVPALLLNQSMLLPKKVDHADWPCIAMPVSMM